MKTSTFIALFVALSTTMFAQLKVVDIPPVMHSNTTSVEIHRVTLTDTATVLDIDAFFRPGWWIKIASGSYLLADGKKYMIRGGEGIKIDSLFWMPASGEASFRLTFEPLPYNTRTFDFIESDCEDCFKIWGVDLVNASVTLPEIPAEYLHPRQAEKEITVRLEKGIARISGKLLGYSSRFDMKARLIYTNPITTKEETFPLTLNDDGTFHAGIEMYSPSHIRLGYDSPQSEYFWLIAAPGEETKLLVNLPEANRRRTRLHRESPGYGKKLMFAGYQSALNDELNSGALIKNIYTDDFMSIIAGMSPVQYQEYILNRYHQAIADNNAQNVSSLAKKISNMQLAFEVNNYMLNMESYLIQAYMDKNKVSWEEATKSIGSLEKHEGINDYLQQIPYPQNDCDVLLVQNLPYYMDMISYVREPNIDKFAYFHYLIASEKVKPEDRGILSDFIQKSSEEEVMPDSTVVSIVNGYRDLQAKFLEEISGVKYLSKAWNTDNCFLFDLLSVNKISKMMEDFYPLTDEQKREIKAFDPVIQEVLLEENSKLLAKIEENKQKTGYTVLDVPDVPNEELFTEMVKPFRGKAVLVDVWATWCGPCRAANKAMEPLKAQLADKDIVYLYLSGEDSPIKTWENMIPDLKGYHYRLNSAGWEFLCEALNARGVPTYIVLDKEGKQMFHSVGFPGVETMKSELTKALGE